MSCWSALPARPWQRRSFGQVSICHVLQGCAAMARTGALSQGQQVCGMCMLERNTSSAVVGRGGVAGDRDDEAHGHQERVAWVAAVDEKGEATPDRERDAGRPDG
jgi:hypothetical protein